ncbi:MAG: hypothetical protein KDA97_07700, partial [Acidimicrobiales bacterium]|nr:hypothetical protein [Acidimicrobiales bacterium]
RTLGDQPGAAWLAAGACYLGVVSLQYPIGLASPTVFQECARQALFGAIAGLIVATGVFGDQARGLARRLLRSRPLWALGVVSYGIYLWHLTVMSELDAEGSWIDPATFLSLTLWATVGSAAIATASWFVLERPLLRWARGRG